jgi:hypothetical protein
MNSSTGNAPQSASDIEAAMLALEDADDRAAVAGAKKEAMLEAAEFDDTAKTVGKDEGEEMRSTEIDKDNEDERGEKENDEEGEDDSMDVGTPDEKKLRAKKAKQKGSRLKKPNQNIGNGRSNNGESSEVLEKVPGDATTAKEEAAELEAEFAAWQTKVGPDISALEASLSPIER